MGRDFLHAAPRDAEGAGSSVFNSVPVSHHLSWHCHYSPWTLLQLLLAGSPKRLPTALFQQLLSPETTPTPLTQCSISSIYNVCHTAPLSHPAVPHAVIAAATLLEASGRPVPPQQPCCQVAGMPLVLISHGLGALPSQLAEAIVCLTNGLQKMVNWVSSSSGFGEGVAYFSVICIYLGNNPASPGLPISASNHCFPG